MNIKKKNKPTCPLSLESAIKVADEEKKDDLGTLETEIGANDNVKVLTKEEK